MGNFTKPMIDAAIKKHRGNLRKISRDFTKKLEKRVIEEAIKKYQGNLRKISCFLKIPYSTLNYKLRTLDLFEFNQQVRLAARKSKQKKIKYNPSLQLKRFIKILGQE